MHRINWTFAAIAFAGSFIALTVSYFLKTSHRETRDEILLTEMDQTAAKLGEKPQAFKDDDSFVNAFTVDGTKFEGRFYLQRIPQRGGDLRICVASISFQINECQEEFYITQKEKFFSSGAKPYSIAPLSINNTTQRLDGKYDYQYSDYKFFNSFLADEEIINDFLKSYEKSGEQIAVKLKNREFILECRREVSSDEDSAQEDSTRLLKSMNVGVRKYYRRFEALELV